MEALITSYTRVVDWNISPWVFLETGIDDIDTFGSDYVDLIYGYAGQKAAIVSSQLVFDEKQYTHK